MDARPISNDEDHRAALEEIEALWDAGEDTRQGEPLDRLVSLVMEYEEARWPERGPRMSARIAARRLAALGGSDPEATAAPRRRFW